MDTTSASNSNTGTNSANSNVVTVSSSTTSSTSNVASSNNSFNFVLTTGNNSAANNTTVGNVGSGNITVEVATQTTQNTSGGSTSSSVGSQNMSVSSENTHTGAGSTNENQSTISNTRTTTVSNTASAHNNFLVLANTGGNTAAGNTVAGNLTSGDITVRFTSNTVQNSNPVAGPPPVLGGLGGGTPDANVLFDTGVGGGFPITLASTPAQGFFTAGSSSTVLLFLAFLVTAILIMNARKFLKGFLKITQKVASKALIFATAAALPFFQLVPISFAAETSSNTNPVGTNGQVGPQTTVGPQGPIGPQGDIGPQSTPGPTQPTGPQTGSGNTVSPDPAAPTALVPSPDPTPTAGSGTTATIANTSTTTNSLNAQVNTGGNTVNQNTQAGPVNTGQINGVVNLINLGNSQVGAGSTVGTQTFDAGNASTINLSTPTDRTIITGTNSDTGEGSTNQNDVLQGPTTNTLTSVNQATANNTIDITADTGHNQVNQNTAVGPLTTGDINLAVNEVNLLNVVMPTTPLTIDVWTLALSNPNAVINLGNQNTGAESINTNQASQNTTNTITVSQIAAADNIVHVNADTGDNTITDNSQTGDVSTGNTSVGGSIVTVANAINPDFYIVNVFGPWNGQLSGISPNQYVINYMNSATGAGSLNQNASDQSVNNTLSNSSNAQANNSIQVDATTGHNTLTNNSQSGGLHTGSVNILANILNVLNGSVDSIKGLHIGIINIFSTASSQTAETAATTNLPQTTTSISQGDSSSDGTLVIPAGGGVTNINVTSPSASVHLAQATPKPTNGTTTQLALATLPHTTQSLALADMPLLANFMKKAEGNTGNSTPAGGSGVMGWIGALLGLGAAAWVSLESLAYITQRRRG